MKKKFTVTVVYDGMILSTGKPGKIEPIEATKEYTLEDAIRLTESGWFHRLIVIFSGLAMTGSTIENIAASFILPYANCDLNLSTVEFVLFGSITFLGIVLSSHFWGLMADTWGRRNVIHLCTICALITSLISTVLTNVVVLILFRFFVGLFISGMQASVFSYVSEFHTKDKAPTAAAIVSTFMPLIFIIGAVIGMLIIPLDFSWNLYVVTFVPWRLFMVLLCVVNLTNAISFSFLPETPKFLVAMNRTDEALVVLRKMYAINTRESENQYPVKRLTINENTGNRLTATKGFINILKLVWNQTKPIFVTPHLDNTWKLCYIIFSLFAIGHGLFVWFPDFMVQLQNNEDITKTVCDVVGGAKVDADGNGQCNVDNQDTTTFKIILCIGLLFTSLSGIISFYLKHIGPRIIVPIWLILSSISAVALNFLTDFYLIVITFITFLSCSLCAAIVGAISVNLYPTQIRAMATCFIFMCGRVGGLIGSNVVGIFLENNCESIFYAYAALAMSCVVVFLLLKKEQKVEECGENGAEP